jgi:hypothetical protein
MSTPLQASLHTDWNYLDKKSKTDFWNILKVFEADCIKNAEVAVSGQILLPIWLSQDEEDERKIVAAALYEHNETRNKVYLVLIATAPDYRDRGACRKIVEHLESFGKPIQLETEKYSLAHVAFSLLGFENCTDEDRCQTDIHVVREDSVILWKGGSNLHPSTLLSEAALVSSRSNLNDFFSMSSGRSLFPKHVSIKEPLAPFHGATHGLSFEETQQIYPFLVGETPIWFRKLLGSEYFRWLEFRFRLKRSMIDKLGEPRYAVSAVSCHSNTTNQKNPESPRKLSDLAFTLSDFMVLDCFSSETGIKFIFITCDSESQRLQPKCSIAEKNLKSFKHLVPIFLGNGNQDPLFLFSVQDM